MLAGLFRAVRDNTKQRNAFLQEMVKCWDSAVADYAAINVPSVVFLASTIAGLPFSNEHSPLFVCYNMNRIVALHAQNVCYDEEEEEEEEEEEAGATTKKMPSTSTLAVALSVALQLKVWN